MHKLCEREQGQFLKDSLKGKFQMDFRFFSSSMLLAYQCRRECILTKNISTINTTYCLKKKTLKKGTKHQAVHYLQKNINIMWKI